MSSELGVPEEKILALPEYATSEHYSERERAALAYADHMTRTDLEVSDELFARVQAFFAEDEIVELTATIAWENCSSKFNRALRVDAQNLWAQALAKRGKRQTER